MKKTAAVMLALLSLAGPAQAEENVPVVPFPDPQCTKPDLNLIKPPELKHVGNMYHLGPVGSYNSRVKAFNRATEVYASCIHTYVEDANREVERVQNQANSDMKRIRDNANATMAAIQDKIRKAVAEGNDFVAEQNAMAAAPEKGARAIFPVAALMRFAMGSRPLSRCAFLIYAAVRA